VYFIDIFSTSFSAVAGIYKPVKQKLNVCVCIFQLWLYTGIIHSVLFHNSSQNCRSTDFRSWHECAKAQHWKMYKVEWWFYCYVTVIFVWFVLTTTKLLCWVDKLAIYCGNLDMLAAAAVAAARFVTSQSSLSVLITAIPTESTLVHFDSLNELICIDPISPKIRPLNLTTTVCNPFSTQENVTKQLQWWLVSQHVFTRCLFSLCCMRETVVIIFLLQLFWCRVDSSLHAVFVRTSLESLSMVTIETAVWKHESWVYGCSLCVFALVSLCSLLSC